MKNLSRRVTSEAAMAVVCLVLTFIFFHSAVFPRTKTFLYGDNMLQYYPWMHKLADDWRALTPPLWDFSVEAGFPFPGEWNTAAFYPINIIYVWLTGIPTPVKLDVLILIHFAAAMWGMSLFLRQRGVERWLSLFGGAVFCWIGPVANRAPGQANIFVGLIYLPWILYFFELGLASKNAWRNSCTGLAGLALALSLLAGHPQPFIHNSLMLGLFAVFLLFEKRTPGLSWTINLSRVASALLTVAVIAFLFACIQLASSHEYFARAYRWIGLDNPVKGLQTVMPLQVYNRYSLSFSDLFSVITGRSRALDGGTLYITVSALICACFGLGVRGTWRWFVLTVTGFVLLVALAGNTRFGWLTYRLPLLNMVREPVRILYLYQFCFATLAAFGLQMALTGIPRRSLRFTIFVMVMTIFVCEAQQNGFPSLGPSTDSPLTVDQAYRKTPLITFLEEQNRMDPGMYRVLARPKDLIPPNAGDIFRLSTVLGYRSSMLITYFDLLNRDWSFSSKALNQIGARYVVTDKPSEGLNFLSSFNGLLLYERPAARAVFHWRNGTGEAAQGTIRQVKWQKNSVNLEVTTKQPTVLIFAESNYPGWYARINGIATAIKSSGQLMSVTVPAGTSTVQWWYRPWWLVPGSVCWLVGAVMLIAMKLYALREGHSI
jgi:hypothetical protein